MCWVLGKALHIPVQEIQKPGLLHFLEEAVEGSGVKGSSQSHVADEHRGRLLALLAHSASSPKVRPPHGVAFLPILASCMFITFQALLSELLDAG